MQAIEAKKQLIENPDYAELLAAKNQRARELEHAAAGNRKDRRAAEKLARKSQRGKRGTE